MTAPGPMKRRWRRALLASVLAVAATVPAVSAVGGGLMKSASVQPAANRMSAGLEPVPLAVPAPERPPVLAPAPPPVPVPAPLAGLAPAAVGAAESTAAGSTKLAVAVLDRVTGELAVGGRGAEPYYTASLSKVVVAVDVLDRRRIEGLAVSEADFALFRRALGPSDDNAMNALWTRFDGVGAAGRVSDRLGLSATSRPRDPSQWGEMSVPAVDTVRIWEYILDEMPAADRELLISAMEAAPATARDGFDQAFGLLSPEVDGAGAPGAVAKQGWMCCFSGTRYLHSAGAVGAEQRFLVALLTQVPRGPGWESARRELDGIAAAAVQALS